MTEYEDIMANVPDDDDEDMDSDAYDTDEELKEAFAAGLIKPGLNYMGEAPEKKVVKNNIPAMKQKLEELKRNVPWIESLDLINSPAPLAPELAMKEDLHGKEREKKLKSDKKASATLEQDDVHNDFKREMMFYRQAQAAVLEAIPRLQSLNVRTRRPDDYFAQMVKSDDHMNKIRAKLLSKEQGQQRSEKMAKLRELKKFGKKVQIEVQQKRQKEKKDMMDEMKKVRKGHGGNLDFLDDGGNGGGGGKKKHPAVAAKRNFKDKKFGFGGKKRGIKKNDKKSADDVSSYKRFDKGGGAPNKKLGKGKMKRPGKDKRQKTKNKKK